jgi:DNA-binding response OmpR family regulator
MNILIVDDDKEICSMLKLFFDIYSYRVDMIHSGEDVLTYLKDKQDEIKAILRRSHREPKEGESKFISYSFSNCVIDTATQSLLQDGKMIHITTGVYQILKYFVDNPNRIISRETLMNSIQNRPLETYDRSIDIQISRLRKILSKHGVKQAIKTVHGSGYMWIERVTRL